MNEGEALTSIRQRNREKESASPFQGWPVFPSATELYQEEACLDISHLIYIKRELTGLVTDQTHSLRGPWVRIAMKAWT